MLGFVAAGDLLPHSVYVTAAFYMDRSTHVHMRMHVSWQMAGALGPVSARPSPIASRVAPGVVAFPHATADKHNVMLLHMLLVQHPIRYPQAPPDRYLRAYPASLHAPPRPSVPRAVCLRMQVDPANKEFAGISPERAFADYVLANLVLHLVVWNYIG